MSGFDVIGDVHGYASRLKALLQRLGYRERAGAWRHPERTAVFVGDLIDRGPEQLETISVVRAMVDAGAAHVVMGNHEFNAIAYATRAPDGSYCRSHSDRHDDQHRAFLDAVGFDTPRHREVIDWFRSIPLWLEIDGLRVVHACWSRPHLDLLGRALDRSMLTPEVVVEGTREGTDLYDAIEVVLKGPEVDLDGAWYADKGGAQRDRARLRWWDPSARTLRSGALIPPGTSIHDPAGGEIDELPDRELRPDEVAPYGDSTPVLFGHYWWQRNRGEPAIRPTTGCLDFSVAIGGDLAAYRWNEGDTVLDESRLEFA